MSVSGSLRVNSDLKLAMFNYENGSIDMYKLNQVCAAKIVKDVYLQRKHPSIVTCHKHLVKFVDPAYEALFL